MTLNSKAKEIEQYSFLYALANDDVISESELSFIKKLAYKDGVIDAKEREVLCNVLARVNSDNVDEEHKRNLETFAQELGC